MHPVRFIFVGGCPRSGTTLVQNILDCHPDIVGGPEFHHLKDIVRLRNQLLGSVSRRLIDLYCSADDVNDYTRRLICDMLLPFARRHGAKLLSEKTPQNALVMPALIELFPDAKFVSVIRDPRSVVASLLAVGNRMRGKGQQPATFTANVHSAIVYVRRYLDRAFEATAAAPNNICTLLYERLVSFPREETQRLCEFLEVPWMESMLQPGEKRHLGEDAMTIHEGEFWYDKSSYYSNPNPENITKWRQDLTVAEEILVCNAFSDFDYLKQLGYDFADSRERTRHPYARLVAALARLKWSAASRLHRTFGAWRY